jgi:hypothetical protein
MPVTVYKQRHPRRDTTIVDYFGTYGKAIRAGYDLYGLGNFLVGEVKAKEDAVNILRCSIKPVVDHPKPSKKTKKLVFILDCPKLHEITSLRKSFFYFYLAIGHIARFQGLSSAVERLRPEHRVLYCFASGMANGASFFKKPMTTMAAIDRFGLH